jgi:hypothetical protein
MALVMFTYVLLVYIVDFLEDVIWENKLIVPFFS